MGPEEQGATRADIARLDNNISELRKEAGEIYKVIREQNSCFLGMLEREVDKRELCARDHDADLAEIKAALAKHDKTDTAEKLTTTRKILWTIVGAIGSVALVGLGVALNYLVRLH